VHLACRAGGHFFAQIPLVLLQLPGLSLLQLKVWALVTWANAINRKDNRLAVKELARMVGTSPTNLRRAAADLEARGLLARRGKEWFALLPPDIDSAAEPWQLRADERTARSEGAQDMPPKGAQDMPPDAEKGAQSVPPIETATKTEIDTLAPTPSEPEREDPLRVLSQVARQAMTEQRLRELREQTAALARSVLRFNPDYPSLRNGRRERTLLGWLPNLEKLARIDGVSHERVLRVIRWVAHDSFWRANILSGATLRVKFGRLEGKARCAGGAAAPLATAAEHLESARAYTGPVQVTVYEGPEEEIDEGLEALAWGE